MAQTLDYEQRIQKGLEFIRQNIHRPISLAEVSKAACFSEYHFHRIFKAIMNETLGQYITRKKLESAAVQIAYGNEVKIAELADKYGYATVSSFSKAFASWFGCRPSEVKNLPEAQGKIGKLQKKYGKDVNALEIFNDQDFISQKDPKLFAEMNQKVKVFTVEAFQVYFLSSKGGYQLEAVRETWQILREKAEDHGLEWEDCEQFAICHDHPGLVPTENCRYDACIRIKPDWEIELPLLKTTIPSGRYASYPCIGPEEEVLAQYLDFYSHWLPYSGYELDDFPVIDHCLGATKPPYIIELWAKIKRI